MKVLVAYASKHGSTQEIAERIGSVLNSKGVQAYSKNVEELQDLNGYDLVVLGSAVYMGHWYKPADEFLVNNLQGLVGKPVWVFSSGPIGEPLQPEGEKSVQLHDVINQLDIKDHQIFAGRLDKSKLGFGERAMIRAFHVNEGDFRDWPAIEAWANRIAESSNSEMAV